MTTISALAAAKGLKFPEVKAGPPTFLIYRIVDRMVHISGQIAQFEGDRPFLGRLGDTVSIEDGVRAAELCALNILAWLAKAVDDDADRVACCVRINGFVACAPDFYDQSQVISGASKLLVDVLGDRGLHTRSAIGVAALPFNVAVEIDAQFALAS